VNTPYLRQTDEGVIILVHAQPNARQSAIAGVHGDELKIRLHAPPVDGKANAALLELLREVLDVSRSDVEIVRGETSRSKQVLVRGRQLQDVQARLNLPRPN